MPAVVRDEQPCSEVVHCVVQIHVYTHARYGIFMPEFTECAHTG